MERVTETARIEQKQLNDIVYKQSEKELRSFEVVVVVGRAVGRWCCRLQAQTLNDAMKCQTEVAAVPSVRLRILDGML